VIKLYRRTPSEHLEYWESWDKGDGTFLVHTGVVGNRGSTEEIADTLFSSAAKKIEKEIARRKSEGFDEIDPDNEVTLLVEYRIDGLGTEKDLEKRYRLEERLNETLGWTGLGNCDGGSSGSGTMEVCGLVVDFEIAKAVIEKDLASTEFADYSRIYDENV
jgi:hypothetical protein